MSDELKYRCKNFKVTEMQAKWAALNLDIHREDIDNITVTFSQKILDEGTDDEFRMLKIRLCDFGAELNFDLDEVETILKTLKGE